MQKKDVSIAVIGAGLAGLTVAFRLLQKGHKVEIFEARERAGGRILTFYGNGSYEELGGQFLHNGGEAIAIRSLMNDVGVKTIHFEMPYGMLYYRNGAARDIFQLFEKSPPLPTEENYQALKKKAKESKNFAEVLTWFLNGHPELFSILSLNLTCYEGSPIEELGAYCYDFFWNFYTSLYDAYLARKGNKPLPLFKSDLVEGGSSKLIHAICAKLDQQIHYNYPLKEIFTLPSKQIALEFAHKERKVFDKVVLAIPCPTLKDLIIEAGLFPKDQRYAIQNLQYGTVGRILARVKVSSTESIRYTYGSDFTSWLNPEGTFMTWYFGGKAGVFDFHDESEFAKKLAYCSEVAKALYPSLEILGFPACMSWKLDPYSKGGYSNFGVGQYELFSEIVESFGEKVKKAFRPIENKIFFAGEHTALEYHGTMEGAVESGDRTASMILKTL